MRQPVRVACVGDLCLCCYANRRGRAAYKGHRFYVPRPRGRVWWSMPLKKPCGLSDSASMSGQLAPPGEWGKRWPTLAEFLSILTWEDGSSREPGTLLVFSEDGMWKACLHDRTAGMQTFLSAQTPGVLWDAMETGLKDDGLEWRKKKALGQGKARKGG